MIALVSNHRHAGRHQSPGQVSGSGSSVRGNAPTRAQNVVVGCEVPI